MEKLVSYWYNSQSVPENYIFPPETRPGKHIVPASNIVPVVDLEGSKATVQILKACQEFGFFQVINHGVSEDLINDAMNVFKEFFEMPAEDKAHVYSEDQNRSCRLYTSSTNYRTEKLHYWRDNLGHPCYPVEHYIQLWPEKPTRYRDVIGELSIEVRKLGLRILEMIGEGLGLEARYFGDELSKVLLLSVNHYPPCPDPSLTLGIPKHSDPNLLTILRQGNVSGLQVFKDGEWAAVDPIPNAFVVNVGHMLQIISNGKLKSAEHRAVTNSKEARNTAVFFLNPSNDTIVEPAKALIDEQNPPLYRAFHHKDFFSHYIAKEGKTEETLEPFKLQD